MASQWAANTNDDNLTELVVLDLCKTFDMVDHEILLQKLLLYRLSDMSLQWCRLYLTDQQQVVSSMGQYQTPSLNIRCTTGFDDSTPGTVGDTIEILNYKLCADMVEIGEWCTDNKML